MNQREKLTKILLKQGLIQLLMEKNINQISVKELCTTSGINRSTFYLHYANIFELFSDIKLEIIENTHEYFKKIESDNKRTTYVLAFLTYIKQNEDLFRVMLLNSNDNMLFPQQFINEILLNIDNNLQLSIPEHLKQYTYTFLVSGSLAMIQEWIRTKFAISCDELAQLLFSLADHSLVTFKSINEEYVD